MGVTHVYLARHGFRLSWQPGAWSGVSPTGTPRDPPLAAHGVDQARELAGYLKGLSEEERPDVIFSSPLYRCLQTADPSAEALELPILVEHGLSEWYLPSPRGLHPLCLPASSLLEFFPRIDPSAHSSSIVVDRHGETRDALHQRAKKVLEVLLEKAEKMGRKRVLVFTHAATNIALGRALLQDREAHIRSGTCSLGTYLSPSSSSSTSKWQQVQNGDCSFLKEGEERHWDFSFVEHAEEEDGILEDGTEGKLVSDSYGAPQAVEGKRPASTGKL